MECKAFQLVFEIFGGAEVSFVYIFLFIFVLFFLFIFISRFIFLSVRIRLVDSSLNVELRSLYIKFHFYLNSSGIWKIF